MSLADNLKENDMPGVAGNNLVVDVPGATGNKGVLALHSATGNKGVLVLPGVAGNKGVVFDNVSIVKPMGRDATVEASFNNLKFSTFVPQPLKTMAALDSVVCENSLEDNAATTIGVEKRIYEQQTSNNYSSHQSQSGASVINEMKGVVPEREVERRVQREEHQECSVKKKRLGECEKKGEGEECNVNNRCSEFELKSVLTAPQQQSHTPTVLPPSINRDLCRLAVDMQQARIVHKRSLGDVAARPGSLWRLRYGIRVDRTSRGGGGGGRDKEHRLSFLKAVNGDQPQHYFHQQACWGFYYFP